MNIANIKRLYNSIHEGVRKPTRYEKSTMAPYVKSYNTFWYYFKGLKLSIMKWDECKSRYKAKLNGARWKITAPANRVLVVEIDNFWINAVAKLCDLIGAEMGLVYFPELYSYGVKKRPKVKRPCRLAGRIKYQEKFEI